MEQRDIEIKFYLFCKAMHRAYKQHQMLLDMVDVICKTPGHTASDAVIRTLVAQSAEKYIPWVPENYELVLWCKQNNYSFRETAKATGVSVNVQYRLLREMQNDRLLIPNQEARMSPNTIKHVTKFMEAVEIFKGVF